MRRIGVSCIVAWSVGLAFAIAGAWLEPSTARALPLVGQSFFNAYPGTAGSRLDDLPSHPSHCGLCHYDFNGGGPRNPYGARLEAVLPLYTNNETGRQLAIRSVEGEDSDGDGFTNLAEITDVAAYSNTPTFPGLAPPHAALTRHIPIAEIEPYLVPQSTVGVGDGGSTRDATLVVVTNPFRGSLDLLLELQHPARVVHEVRDVSGRRIFRRDLGTLPSGVNRIEWNGQDGQGRDAGAGLFIECFEVDGRSLARRAVRLR
jgi:hypothetical protein